MPDGLAAEELQADLAGGINLIEVMWDKNVLPTYKSDR